jgi:hypothetical protein
MFVDIIPCEDGHAQERSLFPQLEPLIEEKDGDCVTIRVLVGAFRWDVG